jgi:hypothetical protein
VNPTVIVLVNPQHGPTDFFTMNIVGRQTIIVFTDEQKLEEVRVAVSRWIAAEGLLAATLALEAETVEDAERLLIFMSPNLASARFVPDTDPVFSRLLARIRGG